LPFTDSVQISADSGDTISYPKPVTVDDSIQLALGGTKYTTAPGTTTAGQSVYFEARFVGSDKNVSKAGNIVDRVIC